MLSFVARFRSLVRNLRRRDTLNDEMDAEFRLHLEMRTEDLVRGGLSPREAARQARLEFGSTDSFKDHGREARGLRAFDHLGFSMLDLKLGGRMLVKHPGLAVIGTIAVAFAIAVGTVAFEGTKQVLFPTIPLPDGNAIVAVQNWNVAEARTLASSRRDFVVWKRELTTIVDLAAILTQERNVATGNGDGAPVSVADVTASMFELTRVPALMGRTLMPSDESPDAPGVVVIGYDFWQNRLNAVPNVIGQVLRISGTPATVVGVMPHDYAFPVRHGVWRPLHLEQLTETSRRLSFVVGRLAPRHSLDQAVAEAEAIGARRAVASPETNKNLRGRVVPLPKAVLVLNGSWSRIVGSINVFLVLLLALVCGNVALLLFARAASRHTEIVVRSALGASRGRIITQLFAEALVLCSVGAVVGLGASHFVLRWGWVILEGQWKTLPFWIGKPISPTTIGYAALLTLLAATIAGVVPALKVTSGGVDARLRAMSSGGGGLRFGGVWTGIIVTQIALTVTLPAVTSFVRDDLERQRDVRPGFAAHEFLVATLALDRLEGAAGAADTLPSVRAARLDARYRTLADRLLTEPGVSGVTYADRFPLMDHSGRLMEMDPGPVGPQDPAWPDGYRVSSVYGDPRFFDVVGAPVLHGRSLASADAEQATNAVVVNESFVKRVMGGRSPIGRQLRYLNEYGSHPDPNRSAAPWYQIVGVVPDLGIEGDEPDPKVARVYHATSPRNAGPLRIGIHVRGDPQRFTPRLRELAAGVDPGLRVINPLPLPHVVDTELEYGTFWARLLIAFTVVTLVLALAGIYAVMAFAVAKRTREIGVRVALGATPRHIIFTVFRLPFIQIALGIVVGAMLLGRLMFSADSKDPLLLLGQLCGFVGIITVICMCACIVPTRRALGIEPTEALKDEG